MFDLTHIDEENIYRLYHSNFVIDNTSELKEQIQLGIQRYNRVFGGFKTDNKWISRNCNFFQFTTGSKEFHFLYKGISEKIREYLNCESALWLKCWINFDRYNEIKFSLGKHSHRNVSCFGYMSIDPKESETVFETYSIKNKIGQLYIGPSDTLHEVKILKPYDDYRITLGFDVLDEQTYEKALNESAVNLSYIPI